MKGWACAAVSGGPDSMALANMYKNQIKVICHVNYNKRESSLRDEEIVKTFCKENKIKLATLNCTKKIYSKYKTKDNNFQTIARKIRYDFFVKTCKKYNISVLYIAHNLDDSIETYIMQENKKSKSLFYGIKDENSYHGVKIIRPLLKDKWRKKKIEEYCIKNNIPYGIDETNLTDMYERNRIRRKIEKISDKEFNVIVKKLQKYNKSNRKLNSIVEQIFSKWSEKLFPLDLLLKQTDKIKFYLVYYWLSLKNETRISTDKINSLLNFFIKKSVKKFRLGDGKFVQIKKGRLSLE